MLIPHFFSFLVIFKSQNMCTVMLYCQLKGHMLFSFLKGDIMNYITNLCVCLWLLPEHIHLFRRKEKVLQMRWESHAALWGLNFLSCSCFLRPTLDCCPMMQSLVPACWSGAANQSTAGWVPSSPRLSTARTVGRDFKRMVTPSVVILTQPFFQSCVQKGKVREGKAKRKSGQMSAGDVQ